MPSQLQQSTNPDIDSWEVLSSQQWKVPCTVQSLTAGECRALAHSPSALYPCARKSKTIIEWLKRADTPRVTSRSTCASPPTFFAEPPRQNANVYQPHFQKHILLISRVAPSASGVFYLRATFVIIAFFVAWTFGLSCLLCMRCQQELY